jgi:hypothetical protein
MTIQLMFNQLIPVVTAVSYVAAASLMALVIAAIKE